jgi:hypothetical protein
LPIAARLASWASVTGLALITFVTGISSLSISEGGQGPDELGLKLNYVYNHRRQSGLGLGHKFIEPGLLELIDASQLRGGLSAKIGDGLGVDLNDLIREASAAPIRFVVLYLRSFL